jgi:hypothetical protein
MTRTPRHPRPALAQPPTQPPAGSARTTRWWFTVRDRVSPVATAERGDVPGWVLVTLMTAGLVLALWALAGPALTGVFSDSIARVTGAIGG